MTDEEYFADYANGFYWAQIIDGKWEPVKLWRTPKEDGTKAVRISRFWYEDDQSHMVGKMGLFLASDNQYLQLDPTIISGPDTCQWPKCGCCPQTTMTCPQGNEAPKR